MPVPERDFVKRRVVVAAAATLMALLSGCSPDSDHQPVAAPATTTSATAAPTSTAKPSLTPTTPATETDPTLYRQTESVTGLAGYFFQTPSGNFHCAIFDKPTTFGGAPIDVGCQGRVAAIPQGEKACATPAQSQAPMPAFGLGPAGAEFSCTADAMFYGRADAPALPYGTFLQIGDRKCTSAETGITCLKMPSGDSFFISKETSLLKNSASKDQVTVPDVTGQRPMKALNDLVAAGFNSETHGGGDRDASGAQCVVKTQDPAAGTKAAVGAVITLTTTC